MSRPHYIIKNKFQKGNTTYRALLKSDILSDVCRRITGQPQYTVTWDEDGYNKGRMAVLEHDGKTDYISFSEIVNGGRNSFFQSVPSALNQCILASGKNARPYYYFLPIEGEYQSAYYRFMYRLLSTVGIRFLNQDEYLDDRIVPFASVEDLLRARDVNRGRNRSNNSTYITRTDDAVQIFAKVYGANKYESELLALASRKLTASKIELYEIKEGNLSELPEISQKVLAKVCGRQLDLIVGDMTLERNEFEKYDSLRSPRYVYNLLERLGPKKCALCACDIPEVIQGAHIWGVSQIKRDNSLSADEKLEHAINQHNGLWLCENHHKMFDADIIRIKLDGSIDIRNRLTATQKAFVREITPDMRIPEGIMSDELVRYLLRRYAA
jgi:hypothetical protein